MAVRGPVAIAIAGILVAGGLALGAVSQEEEVLHADTDGRDRANQAAAAGNLVTLTALIVASGVGLGAGALASTWKRRVAVAALAAPAAYVLVWWGQSMFPAYFAVDGSVTFSTGLLARNAAGAPSVLIPVLLVPLAGLLGLMRSLRLAGLGGPARPAHDHLAAAAVAAPVLAIAAWGPVRLLVQIPGGTAGATGHLIVLGLSMAVAVGLLVTLLVQVRQMQAVARDGRLEAYAMDIVRLASRVQVGLMAAQVGLSLAGTLLGKLEVDALYVGSAFGAGMRLYHVLVLFAMVPLLPAWWAARRAMTDGLAGAPQLPWTSAVVVGFAATGLATLLLEGALWPWVAAILPLTWIAWRLEHRLGGLLLVWAGFILWAVGNTVAGAYVPRDDVQIEFQTPPGVLVLWQLAAVALAGAGVARLAGRCTREQRRVARWGLAMAAGMALGLAALLEMPLTAWTFGTSTGEAVRLGSIVAAQDPIVALIMHGLAFIAVVAAMQCLARAYRPDWYDRAE